jgi:hypothetical protein
MICECYHEEVACTVVIFCRVAALPGEAGAAAAAAVVVAAAAEVAVTTAVAKDRCLEQHITIRI